ncbi:hypothetical protein QQG09_04025 [Melissococcus plutonius]|uniref:Uncharacterized protein n=2 Tax=Melissococcus plutonius TaxID=33970 RepID=F3Y9K0_MELPT|nr:hypothetical protein [Melissococcus plutonius]BAL62438.1 hypothetical protein MPD5_1220 [Melissococcus plutonius DAT561]AIM24723.1 hypothetical protein MEPL_c006240 [Melissococcus plutonius S1]KMT24832.1 hypothetical protein MEPL2_2c03710 [Melissococcus plutonius]KMT26469.1 hypothetical protein MEPL3_2c01340 [Melissococcus plutonius]KMT27719.1 hypothetical protein MEPL1_3c03640 [Melissococcus plutonius]
MIKLIVLLTTFTYSCNFFLFLYLKQRHEAAGIEKLSIIWGTNMLILLFDGIFAFIGKLIIELSFI